MLSKFIPALLLISISGNEKTFNNDFSKASSRMQIQKMLIANISRIPVPAGFERIKYPEGSFAAWLKLIRIKKDRTVYIFDGSPKKNQNAQFAVLDIPVGDRDLQQCADAVMRLRAEYLYENRKFNQIVFTDNNNTPYRFQSPYNRDHFEKYLLQVFGMCGSASLSKQLKYHIEMKNLEPGDVFIRGGFPGHAVLVMDVAKNKEGKKIFLLAQGYMPAQDIHVLVNPFNKTLSPWYEVNDDTNINTPEYTFSRHELKRW